jgi:hypothetical protein
MCCGNAIKNYKMKLDLFGKTKGTTMLQGHQRKLHLCPLLQPYRSMNE